MRIIKTVRHKPIIKKNQANEDSLKLLKVQRTQASISYWSLIFALLAFAATTYFSNIYEDRTISVSFLGSDITNTSIAPKFVYANKGNKSATIIENTIIFHQKQNDIEKNGLSFDITREDSLAYNPLVIKEKDQVFRKLKQNLFFDKSYSTDSLDLKDTIKVSIFISYVNTNGRFSSNIFPLGIILLDDQYNIKYYKFDLFVNDLKSKYYTTSMYRISD